MKFFQALALIGLLCFGIGGLSRTAAAAPLAQVQLPGAVDNNGLVVEVKTGRNAAIAAGAVLGVLGAAAIANSAERDRVYDDDDDDDVDDVDDDAPRYRLHCRFGVWVDHRGVPHCRR